MATKICRNTLLGLLRPAPISVPPIKVLKLLKKGPKPRTKWIKH
ncbi:hypothetical protein COLO4_36374 [Corchorus olitorius]|uniref:Uncharacterized protein n=1 Tax=Corchorus olitorius TaxID=93759 RepID=A0A1R3G963_9ROSI|nr:hypothetical protein COLO4_36374 [Corchorus olitorius]